MQTYYQKHRQIQAFQYNGTMRNLMEILNLAKFRPWLDIPYYQDVLAHPIIEFDNGRQIKAVHYLNRVAHSNYTIWPHYHVKRRHRRFNHLIKWRKHEIYQRFNHINQTVVKIGHHRHYVNNHFDNAGNELSFYYAKHQNLHCYKYYQAFKTLQVGDYVIISSNMVKLKTTKGHNIYRCSPKLNIYNQADFEAHWSKTPIRK